MNYSARAVKHDSSSCGTTFQSVGCRFGDMKETTKDYLARNILMLLDYHRWSKADLAKRSGVSSRMISYIINKERTATIEVADEIGAAFGINGWLMISPYLTIDSYKKLDSLNSNYNKASKEGRSHIDMVADREATYSTPSK